MASVRSPFGELFSLADMGDVDGTLTAAYYLDLTGAAGCLIIQGPVDTGGDGGAGIDVIEFSRDGGISWAAATAALIKQGHAGLMAEDGSAAAIANAAMNSAGVEPTTVGAQVFSLGPFRGPVMIRCGRKTTTTAGTTWTTHAPAVAAIRIG
jgi:hypothetical protein